MFNEERIGIAILDKNLKIRKYNRSFYELFGYKPEELDDKTYLDMIPETKRENASKVIKALFNSEINKYVAEAVYFTKSQKEIWLKLIATVIHDQEGNPEFILGMGEDITERVLSKMKLEKAKIKAEESDKLKTAFLTSI